MEAGVSKTIAFLATHSEELVEMQKPSLEALLKSNRANQVKQWNAAKNFWTRHAAKLAAEQREYFQDWEFVLCDMSTLPSVAFLPRLQRCLDRTGSFLMQHAETSKQLGAKTLQEVLRSRSMKAESMSVFTRLLLDRHADKFTAEQEELVLRWESGLCEKSGEGEAGAESGAIAEDVSKIIAFLAQFADELVSMEKQTLEALLKSNRASQVKEWNAAKNFWTRKAMTLGADQRLLLDDWEFVLCDMSTLPPVAFLPRLQRCMDRSQIFVNQNAETIKQLRGKTLQNVLRGRHLKDNCMAVFTSVLLERYYEKFTDEQEELVVQWEAELCEKSAEVLARAEASRAKGLLGVQHFFSRHAYKIVQLAKQTMREVVTVNLANTNVEWNHAKNFYTRHWHLLTVDQKDMLDDWEFVLCDMTGLDAMAFLPRMERCFDRSHLFLQQHAEAIKQLGADSLQGVLHSRQLKDDPMSVFMLCFLDRYCESFTEAQKDSMSMWEVEFCRSSTEAQERARRSCARAFLRTQVFLAQFADEIVHLQKNSLREVVLSNQANKHAEWKQAQNFFVRHSHFLTVEQRELLEDWEFALCEVASTDPVSLGSFHHRCLQRVQFLLTERAAAIQKIGAGNLHLALRSRHMLQFPMSTFARVFLERHSAQLAAEQSESIRVWEEKLCRVSAEAREEASRRRAAALVQVQFFLAQHASEIVELRKPTLQEVVMSNQANRSSEWNNAKNFWVRHLGFLTVEQKEVLEDWEFVLCDMSTLDAVALLPRLQRCFGRAQLFFSDYREELKRQHKQALVSILETTDMESQPMSSFCAVLLKRYRQRLSVQQAAEVEGWERDLCVSQTDLVDKFLSMLQRRETDLKTLGVSSVEQLFSGHNKKADEDLRFGYDFVRRQWHQLARADQERVKKALEPLVHKVEQMPVKAPHDAKPHVSETVLGEQLPRPRLPKSLRQLYGNSMDAESRIMPFFHRVHEVDSYMLEMEFQDCDYCKEGWFGIGAGRSKSRLPGAFENQAFQKTNFCRAPEKDWLEASRPICENCLHEAKERAKAMLPKEPFRLTAANHADPGDSLPELDALTFFEEEILSPIQHLVRIFTLYGTGQCELRGHVGNLFQNGPQFVRDIPAAVGDMKMLLIRRCNKDPHRKQRVPFLVSRLRLERALDRLCRPVDQGGSVALRAGGLTPEGYLGFVKRDNLQQYSNTEEGEEPEGLEVQEVQQEIWKKIDKRLFAMWISNRLSLQLAARIRVLHEPEESESDADRIQKTWDGLRQKLDELTLEVGGPEELVTASLVGYLVGTHVSVFSDDTTGRGSVFSDDRMPQGSVFPDDPMTGGVSVFSDDTTGRRSVFSDDRMPQGSVFPDDPMIGGVGLNKKHVGHDTVEQVLHDELTAVQELAAWEDQPLVPEGFWAPEDLSAQQTQQDMQDDLWNALLDAHRSDALTSAKLKRHGAARVEGLPIVDPPTVLSRNQLIREDHPYYIAAGFLKLFPLGHGDYWAHVQERADNEQPLSFWEWLKHLLLRSDGRFQSHPRFYFFALNTALRNKALRARTYFVKRQMGLNTSDSYTNEELMNMGKAQFTKVIAAFEQAMIGSAQEKLQQRSDLEALVEQIEQETLEHKAEEVLHLWQATVNSGTQLYGEGTQQHENWQQQCAAAQEVLETVLGTEAE